VTPTDGTPHGARLGLAPRDAVALTVRGRVSEPRSIPILRTARNDADHLVSLAGESERGFGHEPTPHELAAIADYCPVFRVDYRWAGRPPIDVGAPNTSASSRAHALTLAPSRMSLAGTLPVILVIGNRR